MGQEENVLTEKKRIMGLDFGTRTVGVAITDPLGLTAQGVEIIRRERTNKLRSTVRRIRELIRVYRPVLIVLGLPLNMDGTRGARVEATERFGDLLKEKTGLPVEYMDERLTTVEAYEIMDETGRKRDQQKDYVDELAAMLILKAYLSKHPVR